MISPGSSKPSAIPTSFLMNDPRGISRPEGSADAPFYPPNRQNDVLSFHKEQSMGVNHNIIHLFRQDGFSQQQAYDQVDKLLRKRYREWYLAHADIPVWGEEVDMQVQLYVKGCQDVVLANLYWRRVSLAFALAVGWDGNRVNEGVTLC